MSVARSWIMLVMVLATACAEANEKGALRNATCGGTISLSVEPAVLTRARDTTLTVVWETAGEVESPRVSLSIGEDPAVEIELPMVPSSPRLFEASLANPFGVGVPPGEVALITHGILPMGCGDISAAGTFELR